MSLVARLQTLYAKLKASGTARQLSLEQEFVIVACFTPRLRSLFSSTHLYKFLPSRLSSSARTFDATVIQNLTKTSNYEDFGRIYDTGKLGRCLEELGFDKAFVQEYLNEKRDTLGVTFGGCAWNEEWIYDLGGVRGAVEDILKNYY